MTTVLNLIKYKHFSLECEEHKQMFVQLTHGQYFHYTVSDSARRKGILTQKQTGPSCVPFRHTAIKAKAQGVCARRAELSERGRKGRGRSDAGVISVGSRRQLLVSGGENVPLLPGGRTTESQWMSPCSTENGRPSCICSF